MRSISRGSADGNRPGDGVPHDAVVEPLALGGRHRLRVADAGDVPVGMQHDGAGDDRAGQAAAPHFVDAGHVHEPDAAQRVLERAHGGDASHMRHGRLERSGPATLPVRLLRLWLALSFMRAALPFRSRRKYSLARRTLADRITSTF